MTNKAVEIKNLYKVFGPEPESVLDLVKQGMGKKELLDTHGYTLGLKDINLSIEKNTIQVIMGLSGSGKSTLIRHLNSLITPTTGEVLVDVEGQGMVDVVALQGKALQRFRSLQMSMVFQKFALFPHMTILENVSYGLRIRKESKAVIKENSMRWLERVGLLAYADQYPNQLSGGMQQRVGLARALASDTPILLMDEAFSALDPLIRDDMQAMLLDIQKETQKTIIFITHDLDEALRLGDNVAILRGGEIIQQGGANDIVLHPVDNYVSDFVKNVNRGRVIQVRHLMVECAPVEGLEIAANTLLEDALREFNKKGTEVANVVNKSGQHIGIVTLKDTIDAMLSPEAVSASA